MSKQIHFDDYKYKVIESVTVYKDDQSDNAVNVELLFTDGGMLYVNAKPKYQRQYLQGRGGPIKNTTLQHVNIELEGFDDQGEVVNVWIDRL